MARIRRFSSRVDAEVAASMLTARGIDARVVNDDTGGMHPNLAFGHGGSEIVVPDDQLEEAVQAGAQRALLDNFSLDGLREAVRRCGGRIELEASGGIELDPIRAVAETGVDFISTGDLTKSVRAVDFSMRFL